MLPVGDPWMYPGERYYYGWGAPTVPQPSDGEIKSAVVARLHDNPYTQSEDIRVDVKQRVVILGGTVSSWLAKRAADDDAWDTNGVVDVSNQLQPRADSS